MTKRILDPCCGGRMFWFDKSNPDVDFCDIRQETLTCCDGRTVAINPDYIADFTDLPFADETYYLVVFDPPHLIAAGEKSYMRQKYGILPEHWQETIQQGFAECMRVLKPNGVLIFKWNETQIPTREIIKVVGKQPLFGHRSGVRSGTHWMAFIKEDAHGQQQ